MPSPTDPRSPKPRPCWYRRNRASWNSCVRIVRFRLDSGLATSAQALTTSLVDGLVDLGLVAPGDAATLIAEVVGDVDTMPGDFDGDLDVDIDDVNFLLRDRNKTVGASICGERAVAGAEGLCRKGSLGLAARAAP